MISRERYRELLRRWNRAVFDRLEVLSFSPGVDTAPREVVELVVEGNPATTASVAPGQSCVAMAHVLPAKSLNEPRRSGSSGRC